MDDENESEAATRSGDSQMSFLATYLVVQVAQIPIWLCSGMVWAGLMIVLAGREPFNALIGGFWWALFMWLVCGNLLAVGSAWRRSIEFPAPDRAEFRSALDRACARIRLKVLAESPDEIVLGPRWALIRFRLQEVRVVFDGESATVTMPALLYGSVKRRITSALAESADNDSWS